MLVMLLRKVPPALEGRLSQYLVRAATGVFIGSANAELRERLWQWIEKGCGSGGALMAWSSGKSPRGFEVRQAGALAKEEI